ncbi:RlpA-like double-psi beta-barrel-protein domain-containing protein-containing protein [Armillaria nabsnona]|nr:RlpA-like double-psi beta-barrel-protein domain-containing protein-containing protein [Armillaria nabsnona]
MVSLKNYALSVALLSAVTVKAFTGPATFYTLYGFAPGACGVIADSDGVSLSISLYDSGAHCGESIQVQYNGRTVTVKVVDECTSCAANGIVLAADAFQQLDSLDKGIIPVTWNYV